MKGKISTIIFICVFIVCVISVTVSRLFIKYETGGSGLINKGYYDIVFSNPTVNSNDDTIIKINSDDDYIHIEMPNLNNYREEKTFSVDATNIGNIDTKVESMFFSNIDTNINERDLKIDVNFNKDDEIKGSESKKIYITIPDAEIIDAKVDPNDIKFYGSGFAFFNVNQKEDVTKAISLAEEDAREYAKTTGLLELANTQAETLIKGILADSIPEGYTIEVKK